MLMLLMATACRQVDVRETTIATPGVGCPACADRVRQALAGISGIDHGRLLVDYTNGVTRVTYDSMRLGLKNLEFAIIAAGYDANELAAREKARAALPAECREHSD